MGFLGDLFDDVVDIASSPIKLGANLIDKISLNEDEDLTNLVEDLKDKIKVNK